MRFQSYFNTAVKIIQLHDGNIPLQHFLKQYFAQHKKHGSKDRKFITHLCYNFFRLGKAFTNISTEEKLRLAIFICNDNAGEWSFLFDDEWLQQWSNLLEHRLAFIQKKHKQFSLTDVFPFKNEVSDTLNNEAFTKSFFIQPDIFLRIRPGCHENVISKLNNYNIVFNEVEANCISLSPATNINAVIDVDKEVVIQDYSSQQVKEFLLEAGKQLSAVSHQSKAIKVWDCCAGSGGKSILANDVLMNINLNVSDIRASIIQNLKQRFAKAGIKNYRSFVFDVAHSKLSIPNSTYELVICDAPCTGSGTWSRTPEQLYFFDKEKINEYASRQKQIVSNAIQSLNNNGFFLYITCSVFEKENEAIAAFIQKHLQLELIKMELLKGYNKKADTMFAALFKKN